VEIGGGVFIKVAEVGGRSAKRMAETSRRSTNRKKRGVVRNWNKHAIRKWNAVKNRMLVLCVSPVGLQVTHWMQLLRRFSV
jgi:hypothetical protein